MHRVLIAWSCIIFVVGIHGASLQQPTSKNDDAIQIVELVTKIWSLKPAIFKKIEPFVYCQVMETCCGDEHRAQAVQLFVASARDNDVEDRFNEVINTCINSTVLNGENQWCPTFRQAIVSKTSIVLDNDARRYAMVILTAEAQLTKFFDQTEIICNNEESHAFVCLSSKQLITTCARKILREMKNRYSFQTYKKLVMDAKKKLKDIDQQLSAIFTKTH